VCRSDLTIPDERPDTHNIACNAAIVAQTNESVTVHWRYAADITEQSFADFLAAYSAAGIPAPFYADYADECFTIHTDGKVDCPVKNGCCRLDDWNNPRNDTKSQKSLDQTPKGRGLIGRALLVGPAGSAGRCLSGQCVRSAGPADPTEGCEKSKNFS